MYTRRMSLAALLGAILLAGPPVTVEAGACPSAQEIERALGPLLPSLPAGVASDRARVVQRGTGLHLELQSPDGAAIADRDLEPTGSCAELAQIVAVVIAAWESDVHPAFAGAPSEIAPNPASEVAAPATPTVEVKAAAPRSASYDVAAGAGLSFSDSAAAGVALALTWAPWGAGLALRVGGVGETQHDTSLGQGQAQWRRWVGSTEVGWRLAFGPAVLDVHGGLLFGLLTAQGGGFAPNQQASSFSPGLTSGARVALWAGRSLGFWLDVAGLVYQRDQSLVVSEPSQKRQKLSRFQGLVSLGVALGRAPDKESIAR